MHVCPAQLRMPEGCGVIGAPPSIKPGLALPPKLRQFGQEAAQVHRANQDVRVGAHAWDCTFLRACVCRRALSYGKKRRVESGAFDMQNVGPAVIRDGLQRGVGEAGTQHERNYGELGHVQMPVRGPAMWSLVKILRIGIETMPLCCVLQGPGA